MTRKKIVIVFLFTIIFNFYFVINTTNAFDCLSLTPNSSQSQKDICRKELADIEAQLAELLQKQNEQKKQTGTIQGDVNYLNSQINALRTKIQARALAISQIKVSINEKNSKILSLEEKIEKEHRTLAQLVRNTHEYDNENLIHLILSDKSLSEFYADLESYSSLKQSIKRTVDEVRGIRTQTEAEREELEKKRNAEMDAQVELEGARKKVAQSEADKKKLLAISKGKEAEYQKLAAEKKAKADKIRAALFQLRDTKAIPFGTALEFAIQAEKKTGVRPALILAILQQESNLGANVGTCNRVGDTRTWRDIMPGPLDKASGKSRRDDQSEFVKITTELGMPQDGTPLSCPWGGGWGGAMGPSQFIPTTWQMFKTRIANAVGAKFANPWEPQHAIMATAIYMSDLGAGAKTFTAERNAACRYYSGRTCDNKTPSNTFYGNQVLERANKIQADIDLLSN
jgi:membrane-bound lytic murein transglycosylase B/archaellum component FlaC